MEKFYAVGQRHGKVLLLHQWQHFSYKHNRRSLLRTQISTEDVNIAAELNISNKQCDKTLEVQRIFFSGIILERETLGEGTSEENKGCS